MYSNYKNNNDNGGDIVVRSYENSRQTNIKANLVETYNKAELNYKPLFSIQFPTSSPFCDIKNSTLTTEHKDMIFSITKLTAEWRLRIYKRS